MSTPAKFLTKNGKPIAKFTLLAYFKSIDQKKLVETGEVTNTKFTYRDDATIEKFEKNGIVLENSPFIKPVYALLLKISEVKSQIKTAMIYDNEKNQAIYKINDKGVFVNLLNDYKK